MRWTPGSLLALLAASGCASAPQNSSIVYSPAVVEEPVTAVIAAALDADRQMAPSDTLWAPDATVIANGELRYAPPRFAGVGLGGEVAITSSRLEVRQSLVWVYLEYRWMSLNEGTAREGRATVLLTPRSGAGGWRIVHAHSSVAQE